MDQLPPSPHGPMMAPYPLSLADRSSNLLPSTHALVDLNTNGPLGHVPNKASLAVVPLVGHALSSQKKYS